MRAKTFSIVRSGKCEENYRAKLFIHSFHLYDQCTIRNSGITHLLTLMLNYTEQKLLKTLLTICGLNMNCMNILTYKTIIQTQTKTSRLKRPVLVFYLKFLK